MIREESISGTTDIRYDDDQPVGIVTNRNNLDRAVEEVEAWLGAPVEIGRWRRGEGYSEVEIVGVGGVPR